MEEVIHRLNAAGVRYVLIGGQAVRLEGMPRFSMDWDLYVPPRDAVNFTRLTAALSDVLDVPVESLGDRGEHVVQTYQTDWGILQFHLGGPGLPGFDDAYARAQEHECEGGVRVRVLAAADLLAAKERVNRPQDQADIAFLRAKLRR
jgi:hypothetical protein